MSGDAIGSLGLAAFVMAGVVIQVGARRARVVASAGEALAASMRTTPGRLAVLASWIWLGVHFLAR